MAPGKKLVQHDSEGINVGSLGELGSHLALLGRHVIGRPCQHVATRVCSRNGDSKIGNSDESIAVDKDIGWFQVAKEEGRRLLKDAGIPPEAGASAAARKIVELAASVTGRPAAAS